MKNVIFPKKIIDSKNVLCVENLLDEKPMQIG